MSIHHRKAPGSGRVPDINRAPILARELYEILKAIWIPGNISAAWWPLTNEGALRALECVKRPYMEFFYCYAWQFI